MFGCTVGAEEGHLGAEREDEEVVSDGAETLEASLLRAEVESGHRGDVDRGVVLVLDEVADRVSYCRRLEEARRELVEERLERVVVVLVDEHDVDVGVLELSRGADPSEAAAEYEDALTLARV